MQRAPIKTAQLLLRFLASIFSPISICP